MRGPQPEVVTEERVDGLFVRFRTPSLQEDDEVHQLRARAPHVAEDEEVEQLPLACLRLHRERQQAQLAERQPYARR